MLTAGGARVKGAKIRTIVKQNKPTNKSGVGFKSLGRVFKDVLFSHRLQIHICDKVAIFSRPATLFLLNSKQNSPFMISLETGV